MRKFVLINNKLTQPKDAKISIDQRAFLFGDGIFETCRISDGVIYNFKAHRARIKAGLLALKFPAKFSSKIDDLEKQSYRLIKKNQIKNGILRISISRGIGSLGYLPTYKSDSLIIIQTSQVRKPPTEKIRVGIGSNRKPASNSLPISCKTMQALSCTLNKIESQERGLFDCIMLSQGGFVSEVSAANIFWVKDEQIYTPCEKCDMLLGTIRGKILSNFDVKQVEVMVHELKKADEIFLTNVSGLALPVKELIIDDQVFDLKNNVTAKVLEWLKKDIADFNPQQ